MQNTQMSYPLMVRCDIRLDSYKIFYCVMVYYVTKVDIAVVILLSSEECHCGFIVARSFKHAFQSLYLIPVRRKMQN